MPALYQPEQHPLMDQAWMEQGVCYDTQSNLWFPYGDDASVASYSYSVQTAQAKELCFTCPVRVECLTFAIRTSQHFGIWGGLDPDERDKARRSYHDHARNGRPFDFATYYVRPTGRPKTKV